MSSLVVSIFKRKNANTEAGIGGAQSNVQEASNVQSPASEKEPRKHQEEHLCFVFLTHPQAKWSTMHSQQFLKRTQKAEVVIQGDVL